MHVMGPEENRPLRSLILGGADDIKINFEGRRRACIAFVSDTHLHIELGLRMSGAISLLSMYTFMTSTGRTFYLYLVLGKTHPRTGHEGPRGSRCITLLFL